MSTFSRLSVTNDVLSSETNAKMNRTLRCHKDIGSCIFKTQVETKLEQVWQENADAVCTLSFNIFCLHSRLSVTGKLVRKNIVIYFRYIVNQMHQTIQEDLGKLQDLHFYKVLLFI